MGLLAETFLAVRRRRSGPPARRAARARGRPPRPHRRRPARPEPGRGPGAARPARRPARGSWSTRRPSGCGALALARNIPLRVGRHPRGPRGALRPCAGGRRDHQPARQRGEVLGRRAIRSRSRATRSTAGSWCRSSTTASGSRRATSSGSSSASTGSTRRAAARPAGPASGSRSCATWRRLHGGEVTVTSTEGEGSTFRLVLPLAGRFGTCGHERGDTAAPEPADWLRRRRDGRNPHHPRRRRRGVLSRRAVGRARARGLPRRDGGRRAGGDRAVRRVPPRARAARRDAAAHVGCRRVPRAADTLAGADHHGHGEDGRDRRRRRARSRCRRLRHEAVPPARARRARARGAAPRAAARRRARRVRRDDRGRQRAGRRRAPRGARARRSSCRCRSRSSSCSSCSCSTRAGCSPATC